MVNKMFDLNPTMDALTYGLAEIMRGFIFGSEKQIIICGAGYFIVKMMSPSAKSEK